MNREELHFRSADNINMIHAVIWTPDEDRFDRPVGIIQISHGMVEYIGRYEHVAQYFTDRGFVVAGNDHLGHGQSVTDSAEWGYITKEDGSRCIVHDLHHLTKLVKERYSEYGKIGRAHV